MIRKVFYGETNSLTTEGYSLRFNETAALAVIVVLVFVIGLYPKLFLDLSKETSEFILQKADVRTILGK